MLEHLGSADGKLSLSNSGCVFTNNAEEDEAYWIIKQISITSLASTMAGV